MTSRDKSTEGFLERWSRRKIDAPDAPKPNSAAVPPGPTGPAEQNTANASATAAEKPEFDLSTLPSLESITAGTDIRAFLTEGVPAELARAALRRAWTADSTIRDFVGLAENAWDFNDPTAMPGFGPLEPGYDIKQAVARMIGEVEKLTDDATATDQPAAAQANHLIEQKSPAEVSAQAETRIEPEQSKSESAESTDHRNEIVQCDSISAPHKVFLRLRPTSPSPGAIMAVRCPNSLRSS